MQLSNVLSSFLCAFILVFLSMVVRCSVVPSGLVTFFQPGISQRKIFCVSFVVVILFNCLFVKKLVVCVINLSVQTENTWNQPPCCASCTMTHQWRLPGQDQKIAVGFSSSSGSRKQQSILSLHCLDGFSSESKTWMNNPPSPFKIKQTKKKTIDLK